MISTMERKRIPSLEPLCCIALLSFGISSVGCSEKTPESKAPTPAIARPAHGDPAAALPEELRAQLPPGAAPREVISGEGAIAPPEGAGESHQRHPYDLPAGAAGIAAVVKWQDTAWKEVEIAIGIGLCPHRGRKLESARASNGVAALHHAVQADEALAEDKWFLHVNADAGLTANPGKSLPYSYTVYSY